MTAPVDTASAADVLAELMAPGNRDSPYPLLARIRENTPVLVDAAAGVCFLSRHADARLVLRSPLFRAPESEELEAMFPRVRSSPAVRTYLRSMAATNPPEHTRLHKAISRGYTARRVETLRAHTEQHAERLLAALAEPLRDGITVDLHTAFSVPLGMSTLARALGVPEAEYLELAPLALRMLGAINPLAGDAQVADADEATRAFEELFRRLLAPRRSGFGGDALSTLFTSAQDAGDRRSYESESMTMLWFVTAVGVDTAIAGIDTAAVLMLRHPAQAMTLAGGPAQVKAFVAECLRYDEPAWATGVPRVTDRPTEVGGRLIPPGVDVRVLLPAVNRDPRAFADPDRFDPGRDTSAMLTFGQGAHYCVGAHLTRMVTAVALRALYTGFPGLVLAGEPSRRPTGSLRTFDRVPVVIP